MKNDKVFDIRVDMTENAVLINDMRKGLLSRKIIDRTVNDYGTFKSLDDDGLNYFENFVTDFLGMSDISFKKFLGVEKKYETKERKNTFDIKVYHKSEKIDPN